MTGTIDARMQQMLGYFLIALLQKKERIKYTKNSYRKYLITPIIMNKVYNNAEEAIAGIETELC